jgi:hypothetical protein
VAGQVSGDAAAVIVTARVHGSDDRAAGGKHPGRRRSRHAEAGYADLAAGQPGSEVTARSGGPGVRHYEGSHSM